MKFSEKNFQAPSRNQSHNFPVWESSFNMTREGDEDIEGGL